MNNFVKNKTYSSIAWFTILLTIYSECVGVKQAYIRANLCIADDGGRSC